MKAEYIIKRLEEIYPLSAAASWDNPGLQAGRREKEVRKVFLGLDATFEVIQEAKNWGADLLVTHHPLIMGSLKKVTTDDFLGRKMVELIQADIPHYAMHTNFDVVTMAALSAEKLGLWEMEVLEPLFTDESGKVQGFGRVGNLQKKVTLKELSEEVKRAFGLETVKVFGNPDTWIHKAAILPGSGKSMVDAALKSGAEVLISGDFGHHEGLDAMDQGMTIIDAGHYGLEHIFMEYMEEFFKKEFPELEVKTARIQNPFTVW